MNFHVFFITFRASILDDFLMDFFHFFNEFSERRFSENLILSKDSLQKTRIRRLRNRIDFSSKLVHFVVDFWFIFHGNLEKSHRIPENPEDSCLGGKIHHPACDADL